MRYEEYALTPPRLISFRSTVPGGTRPFRAHHHTQFEIGYILSGSGIYRTRDTAYPFRAGDVFLFSTDEVHCITDIDWESDFSLLNIQFEPRYVWADGEAEDLSLLRIFFDRSPAFRNRLDPDNPATAEIGRMLLSIERELREGREEYARMVRLTLFSLLITLLRAYPYTNDRPQKPSPCAVSLSGLGRAMTYIDEHLTEPLRLDEVAAAAAMNKTYFSGLFKKYNGITPWDYITIKRVEHAVQLLKTGRDNVLAIAVDCGFSSSSNFYKAFRRITGKSPNAFRLKP